MNCKKCYFALYLIIILIFSSCGAENVHSFAETGQEVQQTPRYDTHIQLAYLYEDIAVVGQSIYGVASKEGEVRIVSQNIGSGEIVNEVIIPEETAVQCITADSQGNIYAAGERSFWKMNCAGDISAFDDFVLEDMESAANITLKGIYTDGNGYFYLHYTMGLPSIEFYEDAETDTFTWADRIYIKDSQLKTVFYEQIPNSRGTRLVAFSVDREGNPMAIVQDVEGLHVSKIDVAEKKLVCKGQLDESDTEDLEQVSFTENGFLYCKGNDLFQYNYKRKESEKILNFLSYGISAGDIRYLYMNSGLIEVIDNYDTLATSEYVTIQEGESPEITVTLGVMSTTKRLESIIADYNRVTKDVRIELKPYDLYDDYRKGLEQLKLDLISGKAPDIINISPISIDAFITKDVFADLYDFMDIDSSFAREMLLESVRKAYEYDGHLYSMGASFQLYTIWGADSIVNGQQGVSMEKMIQILENKGKTINAIFGFSADEPVLTTLCSFAMDEFIDWDAGYCHFSGQYMKGILDFAREYTGGVSGAYSEEIRNGEILLTVGCIRNVADYQLQKEIYGEEVSFIGYPTMQGTGTAMGSVGEELAILAKSDKQEQAWDFVKYFIQHGYNDLCFPTYKKNFDAFIAAAMEDTTREYAGRKYMEPKGIYAHGDDYIEVFAAKQQDVDRILALINGVTTRYKYNTDIQNIINEEAESYFLGQKDYESVAKIIQSRINIYLSEQVE